jgi:hypothetical protein
VQRAVVLAALFAAAAAQAQVYRWVDEKGSVHYGERPPSGVAAKPVEDRISAPSDTPKPSRDTTQAEREFQQRRLEREQRDANERKRAEQAVQARAQCERDRTRLAQLSAARRVATGVDGKGELRYLDDNERLEAIRNQEALVAKRCG